jgi:protein O-mannosyl-transferase
MTPRGDKPARGDLMVVGVCIFLALITWLVFGQTLGHEFVNFAWVSERKDVRSGMFFVLTLAAYVRYVRRPSLATYLVVTLMFVFGLMSKPMLVTLPVILLLLDYWPLGRFTGAASVVRGRPTLSWLDRQPPWLSLIFEKLPLLLFSGVSCIVTFMTQLPAVRSVERLPMWVRVYNACISCVTYIYQMFWPSRLAIFCPYPSGRRSIWPVVFAIALLVAVTVGALRLRRKRPYFLVGWLWYLAMLMPVLGIAQVVWSVSVKNSAALLFLSRMLVSCARE